MEQIIGNRGIFFIFLKNRCNNGHADVIIAVIAVSIFKNGLNDVIIAVIAVSIFNNGQHDINACYCSVHF